MPIFYHDNICFNYLDIGTGTPFIYLHGLGGDINQVLDNFGENPNIRLMSLDFRGHGATKPLGSIEKLNFSTFSDDLQAFFNHNSLSNAIIGGISMGAGVSLHFTLQYPDKVKGLILARPAWLDHCMPPNLIAFLHVATLIRIHGAKEGKKKYLATNEYLDLQKTSPAVADSLAGQFDRENAEELVSVLERMPAAAPSNNRNQWKKIAIPTLILATDNDPLHPAEYARTMAELIPGARYEEIISKSVDKRLHNLQSRQKILQFINQVS